MRQESRSEFSDSLIKERQGLMIDLWEVLGKELGSAFIKQYGAPFSESFKHWTLELMEFNSAELFAGFDRFKHSGSTYISLNVFRNHCRSTDTLIGHSLDDAHALVCAGEWRRIHPAFRAICSAHRFKLRSLAHAESRRIFVDLYRKVCALVAQGGEFEQPALEHKTTPQPRTENARRVGKAALAELLGR